MSVNKLLKIGFDRLGYDYEYLKNMSRLYYQPPYLFKDEDRLLQALHRAHEEGRVITVYPDFDVDGVTAGGTLYAGLSVMGFNVHLFTPGTRRGYGMQFEDADRLLSEYPDTEIVLTCDVGIGAWEVIGYLQSHDIDVYVTDHHPEKRRTSADVIVDPSRTDDESPFKGVCGAFVAWHLMMTYARIACEPQVQDLVQKLVLFAGLGCVGDNMPVLHDTRAAILDSLHEFNALLDCEDVSEYLGTDAASLPDAYAALFENLRHLHFYMLRRRQVSEGDVDDETYGFRYCPVFNSFKRLGGDLSTLNRLLYTRYEWDSVERDALCQALIDQNTSRKTLSQDLFRQLDGDPRQALAPYIYLVDAFAGMLGPLAARIMEKTGLPCIVMRPDGDGFKGSGRTPAWFEAGGMFDVDGASHDGHEHAFGISVAASGLKPLWSRMHAASASRPAGSGDFGKHVRVCVNGHAPGAAYDLSVSRADDHDVIVDYVRAVNGFRPFGEGLQEPEFLLTFHKSDIRRTMAMGEGKVHLKLELDRNITVVWFSNASFLDEVERDGADQMYGLTGTFSMNRFNGSESLQFLASGRAML